MVPNFLGHPVDIIVDIIDNVLSDYLCWRN